jgi:hypothetical protein
MQLEYYSLPIALHRILYKQELQKCSLQQSIIQHLHLLVTTSFGEVPGNERFGCNIWDNDFDNVTSPHKLKEIIRQSLLQSIQEQEKRITNVKVELVIFQDELADISGARRIKKRIDLAVSAIIQLTNERIQFRDTFFIGPFST